MSQPAVRPPTPAMDYLRDTFGTLDLKGSSVHEIEPYWLEEVGPWPRSVLEIGTGEGYSALMWAMHGARVWTLDVLDPTDPEQAEIWGEPFDRSMRARDMWQRAGVGNLVDSWVGPSDSRPLDEFVSGEFELVFVDGDHTASGVQVDFQETRGIGAPILFHDFNRAGARFAPYTAWLCAIGGTRVGPHSLLWRPDSGGR